MPEYDNGQVPTGALEQWSREAISRSHPGYELSRFLYSSYFRTYPSPSQVHPSYPVASCPEGLEAINRFLDALLHPWTLGSFFSLQ